MHGLTATAWGNPAAWVTASTSTVKLKVDCICCMVFMDGGPHSNWSLVTEPSVYTMRSCGLQFSWIRSLIIDCFACWPFSTGLSQVFWQESYRDIKISLGTFPTACLLELLQNWVLCFHPSKTYPVQVYTFVLHSFMEWVVTILDGTEVKGNEQADRMDGKATIKAGLRLKIWSVKELETLHALTLDHLPWKDERGMLSIGQTWNWDKGNIGKTNDRWGIDNILNCTVTCVWYLSQ